MIKILNKIYNHVLEVYVFNLENKDGILITESETKKPNLRIGIRKALPCGLRR